MHLIEHLGLLSRHVHLIGHVGLFASQVFGVAENEESGDSLVERVLAEGEQMGADGTTSSLTCGPSFRAEAIIDKEVVRADIPRSKTLIKCSA